MARAVAIACKELEEWSVRFKSGVKLPLRSEGGCGPRHKAIEVKCDDIVVRGPPGLSTPLAVGFVGEKEGHRCSEGDYVHTCSVIPGLQNSGRGVMSIKGRGSSWDKMLTGNGDRNAASHRALCGSEEEPRMEGSVDEFCLMDGSRHVSLVELPIWVDGVVSGGSGSINIRLHGKPDEGSPSVACHVDMWRLQIASENKPRFYVRKKQGYWIALKKPRAVYFPVMKDAFLIGYFLNFIKGHPQTTVEDAQEYLIKECSFGEGKPSLSTLAQHPSIIKSFMDEDEQIRNASILKAIFPKLFGNSGACVAEERRASSKVRRGVSSSGQLDHLSREPQKDSQPSLQGGKPLVSPRSHKRKLKKGDAVSPSVSAPDLRQSSQPKETRSRKTRRNSKDQAEVINSQDDDANFDDPAICAICDDGGDLVFCEGPCRRHFHGTKSAATNCETLGYTDKELERMDKFCCQNCVHKQHQCFACGVLGYCGENVKLQELLQVYMCSVASCKRYYHAQCVAELLVPQAGQKKLARNFEHGIDSMICPRHKCWVCGQFNMNCGELVVCRRCPKAWHKTCLMMFKLSGQLPKITFWRHQDREFVYCRDHKILPDLQAPSQDHLLFPKVEEPDHAKVKKVRIKRKAHRSPRVAVVGGHLGSLSTSSRFMHQGRLSKFSGSLVVAKPLLQVDPIK